MFSLVTQGQISLYAAEQLKALTMVDALSNDRPPEKRKVGSSNLPLTTTFILC
jgi:hypothetical protein